MLIRYQGQKVCIHKSRNNPPVTFDPGNSIIATGCCYRSSFFVISVIILVIILKEVY